MKLSKTKFLVAEREEQEEFTEEHVECVDYKGVNLTEDDAGIKIGVEGQVTNETESEEKEGKRDRLERMANLSVHLHAAKLRELDDGVSLTGLEVSEQIPVVQIPHTPTREIPGIQDPSSQKHENIEILEILESPDDQHNEKMTDNKVEEVDSRTISLETLSFTQLGPSVLRPQYATLTKCTKIKSTNEDTNLLQDVKDDEIGAFGVNLIQADSKAEVVENVSKRSSRETSLESDKPQKDFTSSNKEIDLQEGVRSDEAVATGVDVIDTDELRTRKEEVSENASERSSLKISQDGKGLEEDLILSTKEINLQENGKIDEITASDVGIFAADESKKGKEEKSLDERSCQETFLESNKLQKDLISSNKETNSQEDAKTDETTACSVNVLMADEPKTMKEGVIENVPERASHEISNEPEKDLQSFENTQKVIDDDAGVKEAFHGHLCKNSDSREHLEKENSLVNRQDAIISEIKEIEEEFFDANDDASEIINSENAKIANNLKYYYEDCKNPDFDVKNKGAISRTNGDKN